MYKLQSLQDHINEGVDAKQFELLRRKVSGRYSKRFDITKSDQFITIDVGDFNINIVAPSDGGVFVEMDSDNPKNSKEYGVRDYDKIFKVIDNWVKKHVNESVDESVKIKKEVSTLKELEKLLKDLKKTGMSDHIGIETSRSHNGKGLHNLYIDYNDPSDGIIELDLELNLMYDKPSFSVSGDHGDGDGKWTADDPVKVINNMLSKKGVFESVDEAKKLSDKEIVKRIEELELEIEKARKKGKGVIPLNQERKRLVRQLKTGTSSYIKRHGPNKGKAIRESMSTLQAAQRYLSNRTLLKKKPLDQLKDYLSYLNDSILSKFPKDPKILKIKDEVLTMISHMKSGKMKHDIEDVSDLVLPLTESLLTSQDVFEDSAGIIELLKDLKVKDLKGKTITLKKGARGTHKRIGWDSDFFVYNGESIPMMYKGKEQFPEKDVEIII